MHTIRPALVALTAVALVVCDTPTLRGMFDQWRTDEDMGHGFVVPVVILWIVWRERGRWSTLPPQPSWWGLVLLTVAAFGGFLSVVGAGLFAGSVALVLSVAGAVVGLGGFVF